MKNIANRNYYYDLSSLNFDFIHNENFIKDWPIDIYKNLFFAYDFPKLVNTFIANSNYNSDLTFIIRSVFSEILCDFSRIASAFIDYEVCIKNNINIFFNKTNSPIMNFIVNNEDLPNHIYSFMPNNIPISHYKNNYKMIIKSIFRFLNLKLYANLNVLDLYNTNYLLETDSDLINDKIIQFYPERLKDTGYDKIDNVIRDISNDLSSLFIDQVRNNSEIDNNKLFQNLKDLSIVFISERLQKQKNTLKMLRSKIKKNKISSKLIGGTPNNFGRVISKIYSENNKEVVRYSHGGDRGFFLDELWFYSELYGSHKYIVHGNQEAINITKRIDEEKISVCKSKPKVISNGSKKHKNIFDFNQKKITIVKKIGLIFGLYTDEWAHSTIATKLPDTLLAYYQLQLAKILKQSNFFIHIKPHPKGILNQFNMKNKLYLKFSNKMSQEKYDPLNFDADLLIFDYAGSAWFDSLASNKPIILIDFGNRKFDPMAYEEVCKRCAIFKINISNFQPSYISKKDLIDKIEEAISKGGCNDEFAEKFFYQ